MSISGAFGFNKASSQQQQSSTDLGSNVWQPQQGYLTDLWGRAQQMSGTPTQGLDQFGRMADTTTAAIGGIGQGVQQISQAGGYLQSMAGQTPENNPALASYSRQIGQQFGQTVLPAIRGGAASAGMLGGSRQQLAEGTAAAQVGQQIQDFAGQQYQADQDRRLQAAQALQAGGGAIGQLGSVVGGLAGNYSQVSQLQQQTPWFGLQQYAALLGPAILQNLGGWSQGTGSSKSFGMQTSGSFGLK